MEFLKTFFERVTTFISAVGRTFEISAALVALLIAAGLGSIITGAASQILPLVISGGVVLIISVLSFVFVYTALEVQRKAQSIAASQRPPRVEQPKDVIILRKEITYEYTTDGPVSQIKRFRIRAIKDGVRTFPDRYLWTGTGKCIVSSMTPRCTISNQRREEFWHYFDVNFDSLSKGDEIEFSIKWELHDEGKTAVPFLSTMVDFEIEFLSMRVILSHAPKTAFFYEYDDYIDNLPASREPMRWDPGTRSIYREVFKPKLNHKFLIRWFDE